MYLIVYNVPGITSGILILEIFQMCPCFRPMLISLELIKGIQINSMGSIKESKEEWILKVNTFR